MKCLPKISQFTDIFSRPLLVRWVAVAIILCAGLTSPAHAQNLTGVNEYVYDNGYKFDFMNWNWYDGNDTLISYDAIAGNDQIYAYMWVNGPHYLATGNLHTGNVSYGNMTVADNVTYCQDCETSDWYCWIANSGWLSCSGIDSAHLLYYSDGWVYSVAGYWIVEDGSAPGTWNGPDGLHPSGWDPDAPGDGNYYGGGPDESSGEVLLGGDDWELITVDYVDYEYDTITGVWYLYDDGIGGYLDVADPE